MRKKFTMLFAALLACVGVAKADVTDVPEMSTEGNIKWYTISNTRSTSGKYLYWTESGVKDSNTLIGASLFYFTGDAASACYIHNAATDLLFTGAGAWSETGVSCAISETPHSSKAGVAIEFNGTSLNESNTGNGFTTWSANDAGSIFVISPATVTLEDAIAKIEENKAAGNTIMGQYKYEEESYNALVAALATLKSATGEEVVTAFEASVAIMANLSYVMPEEGKFYVIECPLFAQVQGVSKGLNSTPGWNTIDLTDTNYYWTVEVNNGTYALKNLGTGTYLSGTTMSETAVYATLNRLGEQQFNIVVNGTTVHANGHNGGANASGNIVSWGGSANSASAWQFIEKADPTSLQEVVVKYSFTYGGEEKYTQEVKTLVGEEWPAITVSSPYGILTPTKPAGNISESDVVGDGVTKVIALEMEHELPFVAAADVNSIDTWYYVQMHANSAVTSYIQDNENADNNVEWADKSVDAAEIDSHLWGFAGDVWTGIKMVNKGTGRAIVSTSGDAILGEAANATAFAPAYSNGSYSNWFCLKYPNNNSYLNAQGTRIASWGDADNGSSFKLTKYQEKDVTISKVGYSTLYLDYATYIPEDVEVYAVSSIENGYVTLSLVEDGVLPANTGVIVKNEGGFTFKKAAKDPAAVESKLNGTATDVATSTVENGVVYTLQSHEDGVAFKKFTGETILANKAYLVLPAETKALRIRFAGEETGIDQFFGDEELVIYDLAGRRVEKMEKGIYIVNGKKVVIK